MSASLEAIKSQSSQQDGQSEELLVSGMQTPTNSSATKYSQMVNINGHDEENTVEPHIGGAYTPMSPESSREDDALGRKHQSASSGTKSNAQLPSSSYSDVIDRGIVTMDAAKRALEHFVFNMMPQFPIVVVQASDDTAQMRRNKPILFLAILNAASGTLSINTQREINRELLRVFADRVLVVGEKSLELIQALQVAMVWYYPPERYEELKYYQLIHVSCIMAIEIGLNRRGKAIKVMGLIDVRRVPSLQRKQYPDSSLIECRRTWLGCYFLAALTAQNTRRTNLIRWSSYLEECLQLLETSADALPSDQILCHWIRVQRIADEIGEQFNIEDPTALNGLDDMKMRYMVQGFEAKMRECFSRTLNIPKSPSIIFMETLIRLYLHEVTLNTGKNNEDLQAPFAEEIFNSMRPTQRTELSAAHIDSLSISLTSIHTLYQTFLSIPPTIIICLPTFQFVRLIYVSVVFIKLTADSDDFNVEHYLDDIIMLLKVTAGNNQCESAGQFSMVLAMLKTLIVKHKPHSIGAGVAASPIQPLESPQTGQTPQECSTAKQPSITHQSSRSVQESEMSRVAPLYTNPTDFGIDTTIAVPTEDDRDNSSPLGMTPKISMSNNGLSDAPDFDMVDGDSYSSFFMDDELINSILVNAVPGFFTQFDTEYNP
ncbi:hypothetical protein MMC18_001943 [Xylographa bjoerkii]|nr:hypothetical protein [Xylographa bjoerkii]